MKLAIVGSRAFNDYGLLVDTILDFMCPLDFITEIISGGAKGADTLGNNFADNNGIESTIYRPEWDKYGKSAGFIRNQTIIDNCDMVLAFWDGKSRGTADTIEKAKKAKKPTFLIYF